VQDYLTRYGYFPNAELARRHPSWRPHVTALPKAGVFDETTQQAVRYLQANAGLTVTGVVDASTRALMLTARCGFPDGVHEHDEKFALWTSKWGTSSLTWRFTDGIVLVSQYQAEQAVASAMATWSAATSLTFTPAIGTGDLEMQFEQDDGAHGVLAYAYYPTTGSTLGGDQFYDSAEPWSVATPTPPSSYDFQSTALHELGHALGIQHSSNATAVMYPYADLGTQKRALTADDRVAVSALYDQWSSVGSARDVAGSPNTADIWSVSNQVHPAAGNYLVQKWTGSAWALESAGAGAVRIAVAPGGVPWVITSAGAIWQRSTSNHTTGSWTQRTGCAKDIGIGANGDVWIVGCTATYGGFFVYKWNGSSFVQEGGGAGAVRITVDSAGIPYVVTDTGAIWKRTSANPATGAGSWQQRSGTAKDLAISPAGFLYRVGTTSVTGGYDIGVWNEQVALGTAPAKAEWITLPGGATNIGIGTGDPWVTNNSNGVFRTVK
jgi:hypothetical protein